MKLFNNILCTFFGHKADKHMLAYSIEGHSIYYEVKIYDIAKCSRCGSVYQKRRKTPPFRAGDIRRIRRVYASN